MDEAASGLHVPPRLAPEASGQRTRRLTACVGPCNVQRGGERWAQTGLSRPQTGHERSWTSPSIRWQLVPAGHRYAMVVPSWFCKVCRWVMSTTHHSIITSCGGKTTRAFRRIVHQKEYLYEPFFEGLPRHSQHQTQTAAASPMAQLFQEE